jgi:FkbM family methyltransferase
MLVISAIIQCYDFSKRFGAFKGLKLFYFLYYGKFKKCNLELNKERLAVIKTGYDILVIPDDLGISLELSVYGIHEPITTEMISRKLKKGMVCVDIGANIGYYALLESKKVGQYGKVIAIEPSPISFSYLEKNLKSRHQSKYETYNFACSNNDTTSCFLISSKSNMSKIVKETDKVLNGTKKIFVTTKKLDSILLKNESKIDFLRMDIEGNELNVILGAKNIIKKFKPIIQLEMHSHILGYSNTKTLLEFFRDENYEITSFMMRELDEPKIGSIKDLKEEYTIQDLFLLLESNSFPPYVQLFFEHKSLITKL